MTQLARATVDLLSGLELDGLPCYHPVGGIEVAATEERWAELDRRYGRARGYGLDARCCRRRGRRAHSAHRPRPHRRRPARRARRDREGRPRRRGDGPRGGRGGRRAGVRLDRGDRARRRGRPRARRRDDARHDRDRTVVLAPASGGRRRRGCSAACGSRSCPCSTSTRTRRRCRSSRGRRARSSTRSCATRTTRCTSASTRTPTGSATTATSRGSTEPEDIRPVGGEMQPSMVPFTDEDFATARARDGLAAARRGPRRADAHVQRAHVLHARWLPAARRDRRRSAGSGSARRSGSRTRAARAGRSPSHVPRRRVRRPPRGRPQALRQPRPQPPVRPRPRRPGYREVYDIIHPRQQSEQPAACGSRPSTSARRSSARSSSRAPAGSARSGTGATPRSSADDGGYRPRSEWAARDWSPIAVAEHLACRARVGLFDVSPFTKVEVSGPGAGAYLQRLAATTSIARSGRSSTRRCSARAPGSCAT